MAMMLQAICGLTATRGLNYIQNFLKANALINDRTEVVESDLNLFRLIAPIYGNIKGSLESRVRKFILEKGEANSSEIKSELGISDRSWKDILKRIKGDIPYRKDGNQYVFYL